MAALKSRAVAVWRGGTVALVEGGVRSGIHGYQKGTLLRSDLPTSTNIRLPRGLGVPRPSFRVRGNPVRDFFGLRSSAPSGTEIFRSVSTPSSTSVRNLPFSALARFIRRDRHDRREDRA